MTQTQTQTHIPGTERESDPELVALLEELRIAEANCRAANQTRDKLRDRARIMLPGLSPDRRTAWERAIALREAVYHYTDDNGDEIEATAELEIKVKIRKTGAAETPIGEGVSVSDDDQGEDKPKRRRGNGGVHPGLIAAAERDGNVEENEDGDVVVPDKPAKASKGSKRGRRGK